nr:hypothetical protein CFP56_36211 [Quercus suber]
MVRDLGNRSLLQIDPLLEARHRERRTIRLNAEVFSLPATESCGETVHSQFPAEKSRSKGLRCTLVGIASLYWKAGFNIAGYWSSANGTSKLRGSEQDPIGVQAGDSRIKAATPVKEEYLQRIKL